MRYVFVAVLIAIATSPAAAQAPAAPAKPVAPDAAGAAKSPAAADKAKTTRDGELSDDMAASLRKAGFTELQVMSNSVFVRGKDKAGNPVAMVLNPGSMTEVVTLDPHAGSAAGGNGTPLTGSGTFATILPTEKLVSSLIGIPVVTEGGDKIGTVKDIAIDHAGVHAFIIGVGGIFGIGNRFVAVTPGALNLSYDKTAKAQRATMRATADQLVAAPEFKFQDHLDAARE